jgi:predicted nucleic acid-binding protein
MVDLDGLHLVDSSGWLEFFTDGGNAGVFAEPLRDLTQVIVPTISLFEVFRVVHRERGEADAIQAAALMKQAQEIPLSASLAMEAARLSAQYRLVIADSIIYASAQAGGAVLWTQDVDFNGLPDVHFVAKAKV